MKILNYIVRLLLVLFWVAILYAFLMVPYFSSKKKEDQKFLHVFTWMHRIDESLLRTFEQETGIKVYINYYESNEELLTKLELMPSIDCDVMFPSGYVISSMIKSGLIKKIDKNRCPFLQKIYPQFLNMYFDPDNEYSVPLYWDVFGIGFNDRMVQRDSISLDMIFNKDRIAPGGIGMTEDARESIFLAARYFNFPINNITKDQLLQIEKLLYQQKDWVGAYSDSQQGYFLSSETFALVPSDREIICRQMLNYDYIKFALLESGSMLRTDCVVLSASTKKDDLIYIFLDFLFRKDILLENCQKFCILPTTQEAFESLDKRYIGLSDLYPGSESFNKLVVFQYTFTQKELSDFWIRLKAS